MIIARVIEVEAFRSIGTTDRCYDINERQSKQTDRQRPLTDGYLKPDMTVRATTSGAQI